MLYDPRIFSLGDVVFTFTFLQDYATYWVRQTAAEVKVTDKPAEQVSVLFQL